MCLEALVLKTVRSEKRSPAPDPEFQNRNTSTCYLLYVAKMAFSCFHSFSYSEVPLRRVLKLAYTGATQLLISPLEKEIE